MFQDNLDAQIQVPYKQKLKELRILTWHGLKDGTHLCQASVQQTRIDLPLLPATEGSS